MKKTLLIFPLFVLTIGCAGNKSNKNESTDYFKPCFEEVADSEQEYSFMNFYDKDGNRFNVEFLYEPHFHFGLRIVEYAICPIYHYPNEGVFSQDYEKVTFTLADSNSELFTAGEYVLSHKVRNGKESFSLKANDKTYALTTTPKEPPILFNVGLIGEFAFVQGGEKKFELEVSADGSEEAYTLDVSLKEGELEFECEITATGEKTVEFSINGASNGSYIFVNKTALFIYDDTQADGEHWYFRHNNQTYEMTYANEEIPPVTHDGYFYNNFVTISNSDFSMKINMLTFGDTCVMVKIDELGEGGRLNISTYFQIGDNGDSITNLQNIVGNTVFTTGNSYKFVHSVDEEIDKIVLYKNDQLLFSNLVIF